MSVSTPSPMTELMQQRLKDLQGEPVAQDAKHALYDKLKPMTSREGADLARAQGEPVTVTVHDPDEIVTFSDGRQYQASAQGWRRVDPERSTTHHEESDHG